MAVLNPLRDPQDDPPAGLCPVCGNEVWPGQTNYEFHGPMACEECFKREVRAQLEHDPRGLALELGVTMELVS